MPRVFSCPLCALTSKRATKIEEHLRAAHGRTPKDAFAELVLKLPVGTVPICQCGCGGETTWRSWRDGFSKWIDGHSAKLSARPAEEAERIRQARRSTLAEGIASGRVVGWSKGKTKETDARVAARGAATAAGRKLAFDTGKIEIWSKGKTAADDERVAAMSQGMRAAYESGDRTPWALGLTKESDPRIAKMALQNSLTHMQRDLRLKLDSMKRRTVEEVKQLIEFTGELKVVAGLDAYTNECKSRLEVECTVCGTRATLITRQLYGGRCRICHPSGSLAQIELTEFVRSLGVPVESCDRQAIAPLEIDLWMPSKKFGVEYNGLYWHSEQHVSSTYHANKTAAATKAGIHLFHLFEDEWRDKREIVSSMIRHRLGIAGTRIGARKCALVQLTPKERRDFFDANHLDGDALSSWAFGLKREGAIVSAISIRRPFHRTHGDRFEIARFCNLLDHTVPGALGKLTQIAVGHAAAEGRKGLMTYVDTRIGEGEGYERAGWQFIGATPPRFWWTDFSERFNRFKFKADSAAGLTEREVAHQANVHKIWGCPNKIFVIDV